MSGENEYQIYNSGIRIVEQYNEKHSYISTWHFKSNVVIIHIIDTLFKDI